MPNLIVLPPWLIAAPIILLLLILYYDSNESRRWLPAYIAMVSMDQLSFVVGGSLIDPFKVSILIVIIVFLVRGQFARLSIYEVGFLVWFIARDLFAYFFVESNILLAIKYSAQAYVLWFGSFVLTSFIIGKYKIVELTSLVYRGIKIALIASLLISLYQLAAFQLGLPFNGIANAYTMSSGDGPRWAAFSSSEGISVFRPYALFGEPKFMAAFVVASYAFIAFLLLMGEIELKKFLIYFCLCFILIFISSSTSGFIGFFLVTLIAFLERRLAFHFVFAILILVAGLWLVHENVTDLALLYEVRVSDRLFQTDSPLEEHEANYAAMWLSDLPSFLFGHGYAAYSVTANDGFRQLPNSVMIYMGFSGGAILICIYFMLFFKKLTNIRVAMLFLAAGSVYITNSTFFMLYFLSVVAYKYLANQKFIGPDQHLINQKSLKLNFADR